MQIAQGHRVSQRCNQGARLRLFSPAPVPCYRTTPYHKNCYRSDNKEIPCPVGLPNTSHPLLALYRTLPTYLPLLGHRARPARSIPASTMPGADSSARTSPWLQPPQRYPGNSTAGDSTVGGGSPERLNFSGGLSQLHHYLMKIQEWT